MTKTLAIYGYGETMYVIVDDDDWDIVTKYRWSLLEGRYTYYARRTIKHPDGKQETVLLHRYLTGAPKGTEVHHINDNGLDCRRSNMVVGTPSYNRIHMKRREKAGRYRGIFRADTVSEKWCAMLQYEGERIYIGIYDSAEDAAKAYSDKWSEITGIRTGHVA